MADEKCDECGSLLSEDKSCPNCDEEISHDDEQSRDASDKSESMDNESEKLSMKEQLMRALRIGPFSRLRKPTAEERMEQIRKFERREKTEYRLPDKCPGCGIEISQDNIQWMDKDTACCVECRTTLEKKLLPVKRPSAYHGDI